MFCELDEGKFEGLLHHEVYEVEHEDIGLHLLLDVGFLDFDCHLLSVFEGGLVDLR